MLWYCCRSIDAAKGRGVPRQGTAKGQGILLQDTAIEILKQHFGYKRQTVYKHLLAGDGVYWDLHHSTRNGETYIILRSLYKVAAHLGADITKGAHFVEVPVSDLPPSSQVKDRRALLYNTGAYRPFPIRRNDPISRKSLEKKTGVQERQQRRYDSSQESQGFPIRQTTKAFYRDPETYHLRKHIRIVEKGFGEVETHQLPNRYRTWYTGSSRGMLRKVSSMLNRGDQPLISGEATSSEGRQRLYYSGFKAFCKAHLKGQTTARDCYYPCRGNDSRYVLGVIW